MKQTINKPTTSRHYVLALLEQAANKGCATDKLLASADLSKSQINVLHKRVDTYKLANLIQLMWEELQDEHLGYTLKPCKLGTFSMMARLTVHEPTLEKALRLGFRFYQQFEVV